MQAKQATRWQPFVINYRAMLWKTSSMTKLRVTISKSVLSCGAGAKRTPLLKMTLSYRHAAGHAALMVSASSYIGGVAWANGFMEGG